MSIISRLKQYKITLIWSGLILIFCLIPIPSKEQLLSWFPFLAELHWKPTHPFPYTDKIIHTTFYCIFGLLFLWESHHPTLKVYYTCLCSGLIYGGCIELLQSFTSYRSGNWPDMAANLLGILLSLAIYFLIYTTYERKNLSNWHHPPQ